MALHRRDLLKTAALAALLKAFRLPAKAAGAAPGKHLATLTLRNTDARVATPPESYFTFGMAFKKGDIPGGSIPAIQRADTGATLPAQFDLRSTWSDGSLKWCEVSCLGPSIPAGASLKIHVLSKIGSFNNRPTRSLSDITSSTDIKMELSSLTDYKGATFATGSTSANFNSASAIESQVDHIKSGPVCDQWRVWTFFPHQGAANYNQLAAFFYVTAWTKQINGTLATISHITKIHNGWLNQVNPTTYLYKATYSDGKGFTRQIDSDKICTVTATSPLTFHCPNHGRIDRDTIYFSNSGHTPPIISTNTFTVTTTGAQAVITTATAHGLIQSNWIPLQFSSDGTLPTGLVAGRTYFARVLSGTTLAIFPFRADAANSINRVAISDTGSGIHTVQAGLWPNAAFYAVKVDNDNFQVSATAPNAILRGGTKINAISAGAGTTTLQFRVYHLHHSHWFSCGGDGLPDWTSNKPTVFVQPDAAYLRSTRLIPPYKFFTPKPATNTNPITYSANCIGDLRADIDSVGGEVFRGWHPAWVVRAFVSGDPGYAQAARISAMATGSMPVHFLNEATGKIPALFGSSPLGDSGDYPNLGTSLPNTYFFASSNRNLVAGVVGPESGPWVPATGWDWTHFPEAIAYTAITEGGAHLIEAEAIYANHALMSLNAGNSQWTDYANGQIRKGRLTTGTYPNQLQYGTFIISAPTRAIGWRLRTISNAVLLVPDTWAEKQYLKDMLSRNGQFAVDWIAGQTQTCRDVGGYLSGRPQILQNTYQQVFLCGAAIQTYTQHEDPNYLTLASHTIIPIAGVPARFCVATMAAPLYVQRPHTFNPSAPDFSQYAAWSESGIVNMQACTTHTGTNTITTVAAPFKMHQGDRIAFGNVDTGPSDQSGRVLSAGLDPSVWYWVYNIVGDQAKRTGVTLSLSTTDPDIAITPVTITSGQTLCPSYRLKICPTGQLYPDVSIDNFGLISLCCLQWSAAAGMTVAYRDSVIAAYAPFEIWADPSTVTPNDTNAPGLSWIMQATF